MNAVSILLALNQKFSREHSSFKITFEAQFA